MRITITLAFLFLPFFLFRPTIGIDSIFVPPPQFGDTVEFQTLLQAAPNTLPPGWCESPIAGNRKSIVSDLVDPNSFFLVCEEGILHANTNGVGNETSTVDMSTSLTTGLSLVQIASRESTSLYGAFAQATDADGTVLLAFTASPNTFGLYDRLGVKPPRLLWSSVNRSADNAVTFVHDASVVCWVCLNTQTSSFSGLILTRVNYSFPIQSVESVLPIDISAALYVYIQSHPKMPLLYVYFDTQLIEYNIVTNISRILVNFPPSAAAAAYLTELAFADQIILAALLYQEGQDHSNFVFRINRDTLAMDSIVTSEDCGADAFGVTNLLYAEKQRMLFIVCQQSALLVASFNGSIADSSSIAMIHTVTNPVFAATRVIFLPSDFNFRLLIHNMGAPVSQGGFVTSWSLVTTGGMSLSSTTNQLKCALPIVVSAQSDELQRQVLLHECGPGRYPAASINGVPYPLSSICLAFDTLLHRPGTSEVYAHCSPGPTDSSDSPLFVVSVHTDNSQPNTVFNCPESQIEAHFGAPTSMANNVALARNNSLIITCNSSLWLLPLDGSNEESVRMLLDLTDPTIVGPLAVNFVNGAQVTSNVAFVSVQYTGGTWGDDTWMAVIAVSLDEPPHIQTWRKPAFDWIVDSNNTAAFHDAQVNQNEALYWILLRQDLHADGSPGPTYSLFKTTTTGSDTPSWQLDPVSRQLIIVQDDGTVWIVDAYAQTDYPAARTISPPPGCFDQNDVEDNPNLMISYRNLLLFSCPRAVSADWILVGIAPDVLRNASAPVVWTPFLRSSPICSQITGPPLIASDGTQLIVQCDISLALTVNFQCSPGQEWSLGQCRSCLPGTSKNVWNASTVDFPYAIPQCLSCPNGSIAVSSAAFTCTACPIGTFHDIILGEVCRPCPAGHYANSSGMIDCDPCPAGTVQPSLASSSCTPCPLGSLADSNAVTCIPCARGWYTPTAGASAQCVSCEGPSQGGLNCSYGMASVVEGSFAFLVQDPSYGIPIYRTASCPPNHCPGSPLQLPTDESQSQNGSTSGYWSNCPVSDGGAPSIIKYCCWPRVNSVANLLCAQCIDGYIPWGSSCVKCDRPNDVLITGLLMFALLVVAWLFSNTQAQTTEKQSSNPSSPSSIPLDASTTGHVALLLYFVQISSVQLGRTSDWLQWLHLSNLSAQSSRDCIAPLDPYQQTAFNLAMPLILTSILLFLGCAHFLFDRCRRSGTARDDANIDSMEDSELRMSVSVDSTGDERRQSFMQHNDMYGRDANEKMASAASVSDTAAEPQVSPVIQSLYGCYQRNTWYWNSLVLLRRVLFAVAAVFLSDNTATRNGVFVLLHFASLLLHQLALPYRLAVLNRAEVVSYSILLLQAVLLPLQGSAPPYATWFEICMFLLVLLPVLALLVLMIRMKWSSITAKSDQPTCKRLCSQFTPPSFSSGRYIATVLSIFLFCYTSVTSTVFTFLRCVDLTNDVSLVFQIPTMQCGSERYKRYQLWVLLALCIYVIGFPLSSLTWLAWKRRQFLNKRKNRSSNVSNF